jgi:peptidoglycan/LPS O-acetylase OafA/YrhL
MAVPASIVAGIGGILYYQDLNNDYSSWSYMWALIPGFVGVGTVLTGLLGERTQKNLARGLRLMVISAVLFLVFATLFGGLSILGAYGAPILIILLGVYILARGFMRGSGGNYEKG